ncbi:MAG TPA: hypothetical protein VHL52_12090 [Acidimicrobiia bacterium]|nr:hypothetical protein [Acidimicrobiia bacterium]
MDPDIEQADRTEDEAIEITVPGADRYLEILRGVVGRAARICGFTYAGIEDFSLAVDEAAVLLLETRPQQLTLRLQRVVPAGGSLTALLNVAAPRAAWPPENLESDLRWQILTALSEEVWVLDADQRGVGLSQSVR